MTLIKSGDTLTKTQWKMINLISDKKQMSAGALLSHYDHREKHELLDDLLKRGILTKSGHTISLPDTPAIKFYLDEVRGKLK